MEHVASVVIGAGTAGLGAGAELQRRGVGTVVLECAERAGEPWRGRYDGLRLNSARLVSGVCGAPMRTMPGESDHGGRPGRHGTNVPYG